MRKQKLSWVSMTAVFPFALLSALSGCEFTKYVLVLTPQGDSCRRSLTVWREDTEDKTPKPKAIAQDALEAIAKLYPKQPPPADPIKRTFTGEFKGEMPADIGGAGTYTRTHAEMGDLFIYLERFRGDDDQAEVVAHMQYAADQLVELLILWFESELKDEPRWARFRGFLNGEFRRDVKNLALYGWMSGLTEKGEVYLAHAAQYLIEHGYAKPEEAPRIASVFRGDERAAFALLQRKIADRMDVPKDAAPPNSLAFLSSRERAAQSFERFQAGDAYKKWAAGVDRRRLKPEPNTEQPKEPIEALLSSVIEIHWGTLDKLSARLVCSVEPIYTNGAWDAAAGAITWERSLPRESGLPALLTAVWAQPDEAFQNGHFGRIVLRGRALQEYVLWRNGLGPVEAKEWSTFLTALKPGPALELALQEFRFTTDPPRAPDAPSAADETRQAILAGLKAAP